MYRYFIRSDLRNELYNCSGKTYSEWKAYGHPDFAVGMLYSIFGIIFFITYFPFVIVFFKSDLTKQSCYKIMFFIGIIDTIQIPMGIVSGYFSMIGSVFCMAPARQYAFGSLGVFLWYAGTTACIVLALNRCLDVMNRKLANKLFQGNIIFAWLTFAVVYGALVCFYHPAMIYSSISKMYFLDPFHGMPGRNQTTNATNYPFQFLFFHNITVSTSLFIIYSSVYAKISIKARTLDCVRMSQIQRQTFLTAFMICSGTFVCAIAAITLQVISMPAWVGIVGEFGWQAAHGMVGISYLVLNKTLRTELARIFLGECIHDGRLEFAALSTRMSIYLPRRRNNTVSSKSVISKDADN